MAFNVSVLDASACHETTILDGITLIDYPTILDTHSAIESELAATTVLVMRWNSMTHGFAIAPNGEIVLDVFLWEV